VCRRALCEASMDEEELSGEGGHALTVVFPLDFGSVTCSMGRPSDGGDWCAARKLIRVTQCLAWLSSLSNTTTVSPHRYQAPSHQRVHCNQAHAEQPVMGEDFGIEVFTHSVLMCHSRPSAWIIEKVVRPFSFPPITA
jgi:hypothetical protein